MVSCDDLLVVLKGAASRNEEIDVCVSCDWCDAGHTFIVTGASIDKGKLHIEGNEVDDVWVKDIAHAQIVADDFGREFHIMQNMGVDWMISLL